MGGGLLVLSNTNTYTGNTTVTSGTLAVSGALANNGSDKVALTTGVGGGFGSMIVRAVPAGGTFSGLGAAVTGDLLGSKADITAGVNLTSGAALAVSMQWRSPGSLETLLRSDVLDLEGMTGGGSQTDPFTLQMSYAPSGGAVELATLVGGKWENAVAANIGQGSTVIGGYNGSWAGFCRPKVSRRRTWPTTSAVGVLTPPTAKFGRCSITTAPLPRPFPSLGRRCYWRLAGFAAC